MGTPAGKAHDLRVVPLADDNGLPSLLLCLRDQFLNVEHIGAGCVDTADAPCLQPVQHAFQFSVRADHHNIPHSQCFRVLCFPNAPRCKVVDHMCIVDQIPQHPAAVGLLRRLLRQLNSSLHAVAEAGAFRQNHLHRGAPPTC